MNVIWRRVVALLSEVALPTTVFTAVLSLPLILGTSLITNDMDLVGRMMRNLWILSLVLAVVFSIRYSIRSRRPKSNGSGSRKP